jgi:hypothetical protein
VLVGQFSDRDRQGKLPDAQYLDVKVRMPTINERGNRTDHQGNAKPKFLPKIDWSEHSRP